MTIGKVGCQAASSARLYSVSARGTLNSQPWRGRESSASWPALPLTQYLEAWRGRAGGARLSSWVRNRGTCRESPLSPSPPHTETSTPARQPNPLPTLPQSQGAGSRRGGSFLASFAASWPLRGAGSPGRVPPPTLCQSGAQRGHCHSFKQARKVRSNKRGADAAPQARLKKIES